MPVLVLATQRNAHAGLVMGAAAWEKGVLVSPPWKAQHPFMSCSPLNMMRTRQLDAGAPTTSARLTTSLRPPSKHACDELSHFFGGPGRPWWKEWLGKRGLSSFSALRPTSTFKSPHSPLSPFLPNTHPHHYHRHFARHRSHGSTLPSRSLDLGSQHHHRQRREPSSPCGPPSQQCCCYYAASWLGALVLK